MLGDPNTLVWKLGFPEAGLHEPLRVNISEVQGHFEAHRLFHHSVEAQGPSRTCNESEEEEEEKILASG